MLHSHFCAALCASGIYSCCDEKQAVKDCCRKTCCDEKKTKEPCSDCQEEHLTFFTTIGQYHFVKAIDAKIFQPFISILISNKFINPVNSTEILFSFNGFHPPPLKENIIILQHRLLI